MRRPRFFASKIQNTKNPFSTPKTARVIALFFCAGFVLSIGITTYAPIAQAIGTSNDLPSPLDTKNANGPSAKDSVPNDAKRSADLKVSQQGLSGPQSEAKPGTKKAEIVQKRTANSKTYDLGGGKFQVKQSLGRLHYKDANNWTQIDTSLVEDSNAADSSNVLGKSIAWVKGKTQALDTYKMKSNDWQARFAGSNDPVGMVRVQSKGNNIAFSPKGAADVAPVVTNKDGVELVTYKNLWPGVDLVYSTHSDMLKEDIVLKSGNAPTTFSFKVSGANLSKNSEGGFDVVGSEERFTPLSVTLQKSGPTSENVITQEFKNGSLDIKLDSKWLSKQSPDQFPVVIDPSYSTGPTVGYNYKAFKSDGYVCSSSVCFMNAGQLNDNGMKNWRTVLCTGNINFLAGKRVTWASMNLRQANRSYLAGVGGDRIFWMQHANSFNYHGIDGGAPAAAGIVNYSGYLNMTNLIQFEADRADWGPCWSLWGEVYGTYGSYKGFDPDLSYMYYEYSTTPATPTVVTPQNGQTFIDPQVSFAVNPVGDVDGDPVQYYFRVATGKDGETGTVINSGDLTSPQWTVPDGVLQDGTTYYLHAYTRDPYAYSAPSSVISFKVDMRKGKDKTQTSESIGPVDVDLATGNVATSLSSHDTTALGGNLGVSLDYNSPMRSRNGLVAQYWNNTTQSGVPATTRVDKNVDFNWNQDSYAVGQPKDSFSAMWSGYFVAPVAGDYKFGGSNDDGMTIYVGSPEVLQYNQGCYTGICYGAPSYRLSQGQVVPIRVLFAEATGAAYARLFVKGPIAEQVIPTEWLQTGVRPAAQKQGLTGRYFYLPENGATPNLDASDKKPFLSRNETTLSFNWGSGSPIADGPVDFMSRWEGYINVPQTGSYELGTYGDDGTRITIDDSRILDTWGTCCTEKYATAKTLSAGLHRIVVDHYDGGGGGQLYLYIRGANGTYLPKQIVPSTWLLPDAKVLPDGWNLGIDPDGELSYDRLFAGQNSVTLTDSSGDTHTYTWTGSGYKPPVNEDGQLTRNPDGTFTLIDTDGITYTFRTSGELASVVTASDDRKPAALKYDYAGSPASITRISDGVDPNRYAAVYYSGDPNCTQPPNGFTAAPTGMLCAVKTNDGRITGFIYNTAGNLSRVVKAGNEAVDFQYDTLGRIVAVRDVLANDAVASNIRNNDETVLTQIAYDSIGRATSAKAPAPTATANRQEQTIEYTPYAEPLVRYIRGGDRYVTTGSMPSGYAKEAHISASILMQNLPGTSALYSCLNAGWDQFVSKNAACEGQKIIGLIGYVYDTPRSDGLSVPIYRCVIGQDHFVSHASNCEGYTFEGLQGYAISSSLVRGQTKQHVTGDVEPNGYSRKIEWDSTFRTVSDTDVSGKQTYQQWDPVKDLLLSTTDPTGLKATTIYNANDMPVDSYGPAPTSWFGPDRMPLPANASQVPRTSMAYDETLKGLAVSWFDYTANNGGSLTGAPKLHTTGFDTTKPDQFWLDSNNSPAKFPYSRTDTGVQGVGLRATGKLFATTGGNYSIMACYDDAMRVTLNDEMIINDWGYKGNVVKCTTAPAKVLAQGSYNRISVEYANATGTYYAFSLNTTVNGVAATASNQWGDMLRPDYNLQTSQTVYGAPTTQGSTATIKSSTNYGTTPELGLAQSATSDAGGPTQLTATSTYEQRGDANGFLRQTSSSLPGGATTNYTYYGATETITNPCDTSRSYKQGGMLRLKTEPDPDGAGPQQPRTVETVYDDAGKVAATRYNDEAWTCTTYDERERVISTIVPAYNNQAARTVVNNYSAGGNPLVTSSTDSSGTIIVETDLLGRTTKYTDAKGNETTSEYDGKARLVKRTGPLGLETYVYDDYDRLVDQKLDNQILAHVTYDQYSRVTNIDYQAGQKLALTRDTLGRLNKRIYTLESGQTLSDEVTRAVTGDITGGTELGNTKSYGYDTAGRLISATVAGKTFTYGYGSQDASCSSLPGSNVNAGKDSNRTSQTVNGVATTFCYDQADRLIASSNPLYDKPMYDTHGNTTSMGDGTNSGAVTAFTYDSSDRNIGIEQTSTAGVTKTNYSRDVQGRLMYRHHETNGANVGDDYYGYTASGDSPDFITDTSGAVTEKYITLPGEVLITVRPDRASAGARTYSLPNIHGDVFATVDADGLLKDLSQTGPFGEVLAVSTVNTATPWNTLNGASFTYVGQHEKLTESALALTPIQMGARVYIPGLGRFLSVDSVQGGTPNNYIYATDAVNDFDLTGEFIPVIIGAIYVAGIAWQAYDTYRSPSPGNMALLAVSAVPGIGYAAKGSKIAKVVDRGMVYVKGSKGGSTAGQSFTRTQVKAAQKKNSNCAYCGIKPKKIDLDHIVPRSIGGNRTPKNSQPTCPSCNRSKGKNSFPKGYTSKQKIKWFFGS